MRIDAILLTKYFHDIMDFDEWMDWHLNKCRFTHIFIIDNNSRVNLYDASRKYGGFISYEHIDGIPVQADVYNKYVNMVSDAEYVMPIDDDEYVEVSGFDSILDAMDYYKSKYQPDVLAVRWKTLFPHDLSMRRTGKVLEYCTDTNKRWSNYFDLGGDNSFKCIVRRDCSPRYMNRCEPLAKCGTHIPCVNGRVRAMLQDGRHSYSQVAVGDIADEHIRLIHCRYKGPEEYKEKCKSWMTISDCVPKRRQYRFNELIDDLSIGHPA